jgi:hypothetical protein
MKKDGKIRAGQRQTGGRPLLIHEKDMPAPRLVIPGLMDIGRQEIDARASPYQGYFHLLPEGVQGGQEHERVAKGRGPDDEQIHKMTHAKFQMTSDHGLRTTDK